MTDELKKWLFDLAHDNLDDAHILQGFIKYYVLCGQEIEIRDVQDDIFFDIQLSSKQKSDAFARFKKTLENFANQEMGDIKDDDCRRIGIIDTIYDKEMHI